MAIMAGLVQKIFMFPKLGYRRIAFAKGKSLGRHINCASVPLMDDLSFLRVSTGE
jgi:hypothetical protein